MKLKRSKLMKRLTDCGDSNHEVIRDTDSYGNSTLKCKKCGNRIYNKDGEVPAFSGSYAATLGSTSSNMPDIKHEYSVDKPEQINYMNSASNISTSSWIGVDYN